MPGPQFLPRHNLLSEQRLWHGHGQHPPSAPVESLVWHLSGAGCLDRWRPAHRNELKSTHAFVLCACCDTATVRVCGSWKKQLQAKSWAHAAAFPCSLMTLCSCLPCRVGAAGCGREVALLSIHTWKVTASSATCCLPLGWGSTLLRGVFLTTSPTSSPGGQASLSRQTSFNRTAAVCAFSSPAKKSSGAPLPLRPFFSTSCLRVTVHVGHSMITARLKARSSVTGGSAAAGPSIVTFLHGRDGG